MQAGLKAGILKITRKPDNMRGCGIGCTF